MSSEPAPPRASIFLSYASADRPAARRIRDALAGAGLEVWLDEEDLTGGDAWDAKIRLQIRNCTYFMPLISAATEARREGYFRREWRLAVERNLDMADDVTFLLPVAIDPTAQETARVPERFLAVHWILCPEGQPNEALGELAARLVTEFAHGHPPPSQAVSPEVERQTRRTGGRTPAPDHPFPAFPAFPAPGHRLRFVYDVVVWAGKLLYVLWLRLPRWAQIMITIMLMLRLMSFVFGEGNVTAGSGGQGPRAPRPPSNAVPSP